MLSQNLNDELVFLSSDYASGDGVLGLRSVPKRLAAGSVLSWHESTLYVISVSANGSVEVMPGYDGGPDIAIPQNAPLRVNPRFTDYTLYQSVAAAVGAMASPLNGLYGVVTQNVSGTRSDDFYPIPVEYRDKVIRVLSIAARSDSSNDWTWVTSYRLALTPGNEHIRIFTDALSYQITYAVELIKPTSFTDDLVLDCGLSGTMLDIPALGAAAMLMSGQEARRSHQRAQGDPRRAEDVPITAAGSAARDFRRSFDERIADEHSRLIGMFPYRRTT